MGRKIDPDKYGKKRPKLTPEDLEGGEAIILTIAHFDEDTITDEEGTRVTPLLLFKETGDKVLWLNKTQVKYLTEALGDDADEWEGEKIPLVQTNATFAGKTHVKLWVAAPELWNHYRDEGVRAVKIKAPTVGAVKGSEEKGKKKVVKKSRR